MDLAGICNLALQRIGTRTTVTAAELAAGSTNEAIQFNLAYAQVRDELLRLAPWQSAKGMLPLQYITSLPGTPENQSTPTPESIPVNPNPPTSMPWQWQPGLPLPPWTYEYQYPSDCLRALWIVPQFNPGIIGVPLYPVATNTGYMPSVQGPPIKFDVSQDLFYPVVGATIASGGTGYAVSDQITAATAPIPNQPFGAPAQLIVTSVGGGGVITGIAINPSIYGEDTPQTGGYFTPPANPQSQGGTTGRGSGATFNFTYGPQGQQRVVLTNQEYAVLSYIRRVTDTNVMDSLLVKALYNVCGATMCMALSGNVVLANQLVAVANAAIVEARVADGNEALTINDVTPDWLRIRGITYGDYWGTGMGFGWDAIGMWPGY